MVLCVRVFILCNYLYSVSARASCKFVLPKEIYAFFLLVGEKIIWKMCWYLYKENLHKRYRYGIYTLKM